MANNAPGHTTTNTGDLFERYAAVYDLLYENKNYQAESVYIDRLLKDAMNPGLDRSLLELGSGTGGHARCLAGMGYQVTGIERSAAMRAKAIGKGGGPTYLPGDIRDFQISTRFSAAIAVFHVLSYIIANRDLAKVLNAVHQHLKPGGVFLFDFWYGPAVLSRPLTPRVVKVTSPDLEVTRLSESTLHELENYADVRFDLWVSDRATGRWETFSESHPMRYFFIPELEHLAEAAGFKVLLTRRWLEDTQPDMVDRNAVMVLRKCG